MRDSSTFSILFWLYAKREKAGKAPIYARITINGQRLNLSLKRSISSKRWGIRTQRAIGNTDSDKELNLYLDQEYAKLFQCYQDLRLEEEIITPEAVKDRYTGNFRRFYTVEDMFQYHNRNWFHKLKPNTQKGYITSQYYLRKYIEKEFRSNSEKFYVKQMDYGFLLQFESFLRCTKPKRHSQPYIGNNAVMKHIQRLRKMTTLCFHLEWIDRDPFVKFKQHLTKTERGFLSEYELEEIESKKFEINRLKVVRDLFVFSCYTGVAHVDLLQLSKRNLVTGEDGSTWLVTKREKTGSPVRVPLLKKPKAIIDRYKELKVCRKSDTLFPVISNQKVNVYLKEVAEACEIEKNLTFHMARHTFATTVTLSNGVPIETVSKMLGHNKLSTTQIYAKVIERKISEDMNVLRRKLEG